MPVERLLRRRDPIGRRRTWTSASRSSSQNRSSGRRRPTTGSPFPSRGGWGCSGRSPPSLTPRGPRTVQAAHEANPHQQAQDLAQAQVARGPCAGCKRPRHRAGKEGRKTRGTVVSQTAMRAAGQPARGPTMPRAPKQWNLAARAGRWSSQHRKAAVMGWLVFVVAAAVIGVAMGTRSMATSDYAADKVPPVLAAVDALERSHPGFVIEEFGTASGDRALNETIAADLQRAGYLSLPVTLAILLLAFGGLVAAGIPVLLALSGVLGTFGQAVLVSGTTVMIAMAGMLFTGAKVFTSIGVGTMLVVLVAMVGSVTVLPAALATLGLRVDRGKPPFIGRGSRMGGEGPLRGKILTPVLARPLASAVTAALLLVLLALPALRLHTQLLLGFTSLPT